MLISRYKLTCGAVCFCCAQAQGLCYARAVRRVGPKEVLHLQLLNALRGVFQTSRDVPDQAFADVSSILSMVCAGLGVSIIPAMALEKRNGCQFVPLADGRATRVIGAVTLNGRSLSRVQQAFLTHLTAKIASTPAHLAR